MGILVNYLGFLEFIKLCKLFICDQLGISYVSMKI